MKNKEIIEKLFGYTEATYYRHKKEERPIIALVEFIGKSRIEEFIKTGTIRDLEGNIRSTNENTTEKLLQRIEKLESAQKEQGEEIQNLKSKGKKKPKRKEEPDLKPSSNSAGKQYSEKTLIRFDNEEKCKEEIKKNFNPHEVFSHENVKEFIGVEPDSKVILKDWNDIFYHFSTFSPIHMYVFLHRIYLKDKTLEKLAEELDYSSKERIRQLESTATKIFRHPDIKSKIYNIVKNN